jgi:hypothetical protein
MARQRRVQRATARRLLGRAGPLLAALLAAGTAGAVEVPVRCAEHDGHFRMVFDLPQQRELGAFRTGDTVALDWPPEWRPVDGGGCRSDQRLRGWRRQDGRLVLVLAGDPGARAFPLSDPPRWVVDVGRVDGNLPSRAPLPPLVQRPAPLPRLIPPEPPEVLGEARALAEQQGPAAAIALLRRQGEPAEQPAAVQFELGRLYAESGQGLKAAQRLWQAARDFPDHPAAPGGLRRASRLFDGLGFRYQAAKPLETYLRNYPLDPRAMAIQLDLGRLYALAGEAGSAREELIPLTYRASGDLARHADFWLAYLLVRGGDYAAADEAFTRLSGEEPGYLRAHPELLLAASRARLETGDAEGARAWLGDFLDGFDDHPRRLEALLLQGRALMALESWRRAGARFREVLDAKPQADLRARARAGLIRTDYALERIGLERAVARLKAVAAGLPGSRSAMEARLMAATILAEADRGGDALALLQPVLAHGDRRDRDRARPLVNRLLPREMAAALERDDPWRAYRLFNRFAAQPPAEAVSDRAFRALLRLGALQGARRFLQATRAEQGETLQLQRWQHRLARAFRRVAEPGGVAWIDGVLDANPEHHWAGAMRLERARLLSALDRHDDLLAYLDNQPGLPREATVPLRARARKAGGDLRGAFSVLDDFARQSGEGAALPAPALAEAGDLAARIGRPYRARHYWMRALEAGLPGWQRRQLQALLGVDAVQREDFAGARELLQGLPEETAFGRVAGLYDSLIPMLRERLR